MPAQSSSAHQTLQPSNGKEPYDNLPADTSENLSSQNKYAAIDNYQFLCGIREVDDDTDTLGGIKSGAKSLGVKSIDGPGSLNKIDSSI